MTYAAARWQGRGQVGLRWGSTFGKVARASLGPFRQRQFKDRRPFNLTHDPLQAIVWWTVIDTQTLPREVPVCPAKVRPALVYIGGAESETIMEKQRTTGAVIDSPRSVTLRFFSTTPREADTIMFIDNNAALSCLINGNSGLTASDAAWTDQLRARCGLT
jgi:hypothetical protein